MLMVMLVMLTVGGQSVRAASDLEEGVKVLADKIAASLMAQSKTKIVIVDFSDLNGTVTALGQVLAEELTAQLFQLAPGKFEVVSRRQLYKLEEEQGQGRMDFLEEKSLTNVGQVFGVEVVITGSMADLGKIIKLNAQMIGVESRKVFAMASTTIPKTDIVAELAGKPIVRKSPPASPSPAPAGAAGSPTKPQTSKGRVFENEALRVTVLSLKKEGRLAHLTVLYENLGEKPYRMVYLGQDPSNTHLLDEERRRWKWQSEMTNVRDWVVLSPHTVIENRIAFEAASDPQGRMFSFTSEIVFGQYQDRGKLWPPVGQATIKISEIPAE